MIPRLSMTLTTLLLLVEEQPVSCSPHDYPRTRTIPSSSSRQGTLETLLHYRPVWFPSKHLPRIHLPEMNRISSRHSRKRLHTFFITYLLRLGVHHRSPAKSQQPSALLASWKASGWFLRRQWSLSRPAIKDRIRRLGRPYAIPRQRYRRYSLVLGRALSFYEEERELYPSRLRCAIHPQCRLRPRQPRTQRTLACELPWIVSHLGPRSTPRSLCVNSLLN